VGRIVLWAAVVLSIVAVGAVAASFLGYLAAGMAVAAMVIGLAVGYVDRSSFTIKAARAFGLLGSALAIFSVVTALDLGDTRRLGFAVAAIAFAAIAGAVTFFTRIPAPAAGAVMFVAGMLGFASTQAWDAKTFYFGAAPMWFVGAGLLVARGLAAEGDGAHL
jgi:hypothetical protein